jgi:hypothetical protein
MVSMDDVTPCTRFGVQTENEAYAVVTAPEDKFDLDSSLFSFTFNVCFIVPWDNGSDKSTIPQQANAPPTTRLDSSMASFDR